MTWQVSIRDDRFPRNDALLIVWRNVGDRVELLARDGTRWFADPLEALDEADLGFPIPYDALGALRAAIDERVGRRPDEAVAGVLREIVRTESGRVDRILTTLLERRT